MKVISINVGKITTFEWRGKMVSTSIFKRPVKGPVRVTRLRLEGDEQADLTAHGGEHRAVMVYQAASYDYWQKVLGKTGLPFGTFGENLTVEGLADADVCIGDQYAIGTAIFEVTQPRVTCYKVGISLQVPEMPALLVSHKRPGFYFRVLQEGEISEGDLITKLASGPEQMSIVEIDALLYSDAHPPDLLQRALKIPALSKGWKGSFDTLYQAVSSGSTSGNAGLAPASAAALAWPGFRSVIIQEVREESVDVRSFTLSADNGQPLPLFMAGQHIAVKIPAAENDPWIRMYSLCGPGETGQYRIGVKAEKDGRASNYLFAKVKVGSILQISAPMGTFTLAPDQKPLVFFSGGIGITPLLGMLYAAAREQPQRPVWWIHSTQNKAHHSFRQEFTQVLQSLHFIHKLVIYSRPDTSDQQGIDYDRVGRLGPDLLKELQLPVNAWYYLCGPNRYLTDMIKALKQLGIPEENIRVEVFGNFQPSNPNAPLPHLPPGIPGNGPLITFVKTNLSFKWSSRFGNLLEAVEACDVPANWSCRTGVCHRCETRLLSGQVNYNPQPLAAPLNGNVLICCAIPVTPVQLDL
jgi:ferredoxin-NADP reductase/MOSC domain-containing protein YiiM/ferredoxin